MLWMCIIASSGPFAINSGATYSVSSQIGVVLSGEIVAKDTSTLQLSKVRKRARWKVRFGPITAKDCYGSIAVIA